MSTNINRQPSHKYRNRDYKRRYGLTVQDYDIMAEQQNHTCAICGTDTCSLNGNILSIDHDHKTGKFRGLLCNKCNLFIGHIENNSDTLFKALEYLRKHNG